MAVIAEPWTELMSGAEALDAALAGLEHPGRVGGGLERPVSHAEGKSGDGERVASGETMRGVRALQQVDEGGRGSVATCLAATESVASPLERLSAIVLGGARDGCCDCESGGFQKCAATRRRVHCNSLTAWGHRLIREE